MSDSNQGHIGRPVVRIYYDENRRLVRKTYDLDLAEPKRQDRLVVEVEPYIPIQE